MKLNSNLKRAVTLALRSHQTDLLDSIDLATEYYAHGHVRASYKVMNRALHENILPQIPDYMRQ